MSDEAKTKRQKKASNSKKPSGQGYAVGVIWHNPQPTAQDIQALEADDNAHADSVLELADDLEEGERLSIKFEARSGRWQAILFVPDSDPQSDASALSVRGSTPFNALTLLAYFHRVKFPEYAWIGSIGGLGDYG